MRSSAARDARDGFDLGNVQRHESCQFWEPRREPVVPEFRETDNRRSSAVNATRSSLQVLESLSVFMRTLGPQVDRPQVDERPQLLRAASGPKTGRKQRIYGSSCPTAAQAVVA